MKVFSFTLVFLSLISPFLKASELCTYCIYGQIQTSITSSTAPLKESDLVCEDCNLKTGKCSGCDKGIKDCKCDPDGLSITARSIIAGLVIGFSTLILFVGFILKKRLNEMQE
jgi:hypothetical protein